MAWYLGCLFLPRKYQTAQRCQHSTLCYLLLFCSKCAGAFLIYSVVSKLVLEQQKIIELQTRNHQLSTQTLQYKKLQDKITEARRAKHDVRHHITLMKKYLEDKDYDALNEYLNNYQKSIPDEHIFFCENSAVNAILSYFSEQARTFGITYSVSTLIP